MIIFQRDNRIRNFHVWEKRWNFEFDIEKNESFLFRTYSDVINIILKGEENV